MAWPDTPLGSLLYFNIILSRKLAGNQFGSTDRQAFRSRFEGRPRRCAEAVTSSRPDRTGSPSRVTLILSSIGIAGLISVSNGRNIPPCATLVSNRLLRGLLLSLSNHQQLAIYAYFKRQKTLTSCRVNEQGTKAKKYHSVRRYRIVN